MRARSPLRLLGGLLAGALAAAPACGSSGGSGAAGGDASTSPDGPGSVPTDGAPEVGSDCDGATSAEAAEGSSDAPGSGDAPADGDAASALDASEGGDGGRCRVTAPGFYLAPGGDDSAACTLAKPCATFEKAQAMMAASSTVKTTYVRAGTYTRTAGYAFKSGETWLGYPCDPPHSAIVDATGLTAGGAAFSCNGCSNVAMWNFTFKGAPTYNGGAWSDSDFLLSAGTNVHIEDNVFTGDLVAYDESDIYSFNGSGIYIRGNSFESDASGEPVSAPYTQAGTYAGLYVTDNAFAGCQRFCVEAQIQLGMITVSDFHIDRNTFTTFQGPNGVCGNGDHYIGAVSAAGPASTSTEWATGSTIWGNTFTLPSTNDNCAWGIEVGWTGTSVEHNALSYVGVAMAVGGMPGTEIENNTLTLLASGSMQGGCAGGACAFIKDGGYDGTEWVGVNTVNGSNETGCVAPFCAMGHGVYGAQPTVSSPSPRYVGTAP